MSTPTSRPVSVGEPSTPVEAVPEKVDKFANAPEITEHTWRSSPRSFIYAASWFVIGGLAVALLGLVSQQITNGGLNTSTTHYPNAETYHILGLLLFNTILTLLLALGSYTLPLQFTAFFVFVTSVIYVTAAGILQHIIPFRAGNCSSTFVAPFDYFQPQCQRYTAIMSLSWTLWVLTLGFTVAIIVESILVKSKKGAFYSYA